MYSFYLFDVDQGQSAALNLPNDRWCIFDLGSKSSFSPVEWIVKKYLSRWDESPRMQIIKERTFRFLKSTISHFHGDHVSDLWKYSFFGTEHLRTVLYDMEYLHDVINSSSDNSLLTVLSIDRHLRLRPIATGPLDLGAAVQISEKSLPLPLTRQIGGDANARVNNASIVTRINILGNSILLCGDMMQGAWNEIFRRRTLTMLWRPLLRNVSIMVAPHHGHRSGFSSELLNIAQPNVVLISVPAGDPDVDSRYSREPVRGIRIDNRDYKYISTRQKGHIKIDFIPRQPMQWSFGDNVVEL